MVSAASAGLKPKTQLNVRLFSPMILVNNADGWREGNAQHLRELLKLRHGCGSGGSIAPSVESGELRLHGQPLYASGSLI